MRRVFLLLGVVISCAVVRAESSEEDDVAPPAPPPKADPPAPPAPAPAPPRVERRSPPPSAGSGLDHFHFGEKEKQKKVVEDPEVVLERKLQEVVHSNTGLKASGHHWMPGVWLYGEYRNHLDDINSPDACADECEADAKCLHWCFEIHKKRCDLRAEGGGHDGGQRQWITGHARRWDTYLKELERRKKHGEL